MVIFALAIIYLMSCVWAHKNNDAELKMRKNSIEV